MHDLLEKFLEACPKRYPLSFKAVYPRRIVPPGGFLNPKYCAASMWGQLQTGFDPEMNMLAHITGFVNVLQQAAYRVPTYFVRSEFAQAVAQTRPPENFTFSQIRWPMPAMLFVLPTDFALKHFGYLCPFISVTRCDAGHYPAKLQHLLPPCEVPLTSANPLLNEVDRFNVVYPVYSKQTLPVDYTGSYPLTMNVDAIATAPFEDATYYEEARATASGVSPEAATDLPSGEVERAFNLKVQSFAVKLMLALTARPTLIAPGALARKAKAKHNRQIDELWNPNLIGWDYRAVRPTDNGGTPGSHASPRMHWRQGHMRNQPFGPKPWTAETETRLTWIEPILINAPE